MYLIVGLGNPGKEYENTRHNVGFEIIDLLADKYNISIKRIKFKGIYGEGSINGEKVVLLKPQTYMNLSGESIAEAVKFYKIPSDHVIVIHDDMSLDLGRLRIRSKGSAGGHNGIKSIIAHLSSDAFPRIKVGVGLPKGSWVNHVLGQFKAEERSQLDKVYDIVIKSVEAIIKDDTETAMNLYNGFKAE